MNDRIRERRIRERKDLTIFGSFKRFKTCWVGGEVDSVRRSGARVCSPVQTELNQSMNV